MWHVTKINIRVAVNGYKMYSSLVSMVLSYVTEKREEKFPKGKSYTQTCK